MWNVYNQDELRRAAIERLALMHRRKGLIRKWKNIQIIPAT